MANELTLKTRIKLRSDLEATWIEKNPVLKAGEVAISTDKDGMHKVGDGASNWADLPYAKARIEAADIKAALGYTPADVDNIKTMKGASAETAGEAGFVPAPAAGDQDKVLKGNGTWEAIKETTLTTLGVTASAEELNYTKGVTSSIQEQLDGKALKEHKHGDADITDVAASKITGIIDLQNLPAGALERLVPVTNDAARFALTTDDIQKGDTVKVEETGKMYFVIDDSKLNSEDGYSVYTAGTATSVPWSGVTDKPTIGDGRITVKQNGEEVGSFTVNQEGAAEINLADTKYTLPVATVDALGGVKSATGDNKVTVAEDGVATVDSVALSSIKANDTVLVLDGGNAASFE